MQEKNSTEKNSTTYRKHSERKKLDFFKDLTY